MKCLVLSLALLCSGSLSAATTGTVPDSRTQVYSLAEVDRPPQHMVMARLAYPPELKQQGIAGEVVVEFVVDLDGSVRDPVVKSSTRKEFELPALQAVSKWKYKPGRKGKEKVNVRIEASVKFDPKK